MNRAEAGREGGIKTACEYGLNHYICPEFGGICPRKLEEKSDFYSGNGKKGGPVAAAVTAKKYGGKDSQLYRNHMSEIGKLGGRGNKREANIEKPALP